MQLYRNRNEQMMEAQAPKQSFPMPQLMPTSMEKMPTEQLPKMPMEQMPQIMPMNQVPNMPMNQMPQMMPMNQVPNMPMNQMPQMMPMNQVPNMPMNQMPQMMPMNQVPNMPMNQMPQMMPMNKMPQMMPMCPYVMPNMMPNMMPQMNGMMPGETDEDMMPYNMMNPQFENTADEEENNIKMNSMDNRVRRPLLSNNPITIQIKMTKQQTAYNNYGNPSGNADILYTGTRGSWSFDLPAGINFPANRTAQLIVRAVLDDHTGTPIRDYSARIQVNNVNVHNGPLTLEHGRPAGQKFTNWTNLSFNVRNLRRNNTVTIINTSRAKEDDWIGLDWMEIIIPTR